MATDGPSYPATIVQEPHPVNGYFYVVDREDGERLYLRISTGPGQPKVKEGTKGHVFYRSGKGYGLWVWRS